MLARVFEGFAVGRGCIDKLVELGVDVQTLLHLPSIDFDQLMEVVKASSGEKLAMKAALNKEHKKAHREGESSCLFLSDVKEEKRCFAYGDALNLSSHYYVPWSDLGELVSDIKRGRWLLFTGPQCGMLKAIHSSLTEKGYLTITTTLTTRPANNPEKSELAAGNDFFNLLIEDIVGQSEGKLQVPPAAAGGVQSLANVFRQAGQRLVWLVDEASMLTEIFHTTGYAVAQLLADLRKCKQYSRANDPEGDCWLCSFCLCGLPRLSGLIGGMTDLRRTTPPGGSDLRLPWYRRRPCLTPLNAEVIKTSWSLTAEGIRGMVSEYATEWSVAFTLTEARQRIAGREEHEGALKEICDDIYGLTTGHAGLTGLCCEFLQRRGVRSVEMWQKLKRTGHVARTISKAYHRILSIHECMTSPDGATRLTEPVPEVF